MSQNVEDTIDTIFNTLVDGLILIDAKGIIRRYNPACEKIFGYNREEMIGQNVSLLMPEPDRRQHDIYIKNYKTSREPKIIGIGRDVEGQRKSGETFPMYLSVGEINTNETISYIGIIRDLSDASKRRAEFEALQQAHFHLSRISAMDQMGAAIAHELNQPLTAIMNYLDAAQIRLAQKDDFDVTLLTPILEKSSAQAKRAASILSRLRRFIETGDIEKQLCDIEVVIRSALELTLPQFKNSSISIKFEFADNLDFILASDVQLQQVLVNLIKNACEAMSDSEIRILTLKAEKDTSQAVKVSVSDTGIGLSDAALKSIFDPFTTFKQGGLGVGLSISRSIIANHDGRLWAERNTPDGMAFYFTIPAL